jgi:hypothetical protein
MRERERKRERKREREREKERKKDTEKKYFLTIARHRFCLRALGQENEVKAPCIRKTMRRKEE